MPHKQNLNSGFKLCLRRRHNAKTGAIDVVVKHTASEGVIINHLVVPENISPSPGDVDSVTRQQHDE